MKLKNSDLAIFDGLISRFPEIKPRRLINGVIKHRFLRYFPLDDIPREEIFYIGFQALYSAWKTMDDAKDLPAFLKSAWGVITREIYFFIKHEYPSSHAMQYLKLQPYIVRSNNEDSENIMDTFSDDSEIRNIYNKIEFNKVVNVVFEVYLQTEHAIRDIALIKLYLLGFTATEIADEKKLGFINKKAAMNRLKGIFERVRIKLGVDPNISLFLFLERRQTRHRVHAENSRKTACERTRRWRKKYRRKKL